MKLRSKLLIGVLFVTFLGACTSSEETRQAEERKARQEQREKDEAKDQEKSKAEQARVDEERRAAEQAVEDAKPKEPEYKEVDTEYFTFDGALNISCEKSEVTPCGVQLENCSDGNNYYCVHNVKQHVKTEKILVTE